MCGIIAVVRRPSEPPDPTPSAIDGSSTLGDGRRGRPRTTRSRPMSSTSVVAAAGAAGSRRPAAAGRCPACERCSARSDPAGGDRRTSPAPLERRSSRRRAAPRREGAAVDRPSLEAVNAALIRAQGRGVGRARVIGSAPPAAWPTLAGRADRRPSPSRLRRSSQALVGARPARGARPRLGRPARARARPRARPRGRRRSRASLAERAATRCSPSGRCGSRPRGI